MLGTIRSTLLHGSSNAVSHKQKYDHSAEPGKSSFLFTVACRECRLSQNVRETQRRGLKHRFGKVIRLSLLNSKKNWRENLLIRRDDLYKGNIKNVLYGE